jgi:hypothetical protein
MIGKEMKHGAPFRVILSDGLNHGRGLSSNLFDNAIGEALGFVGNELPEKLRNVSQEVRGEKGGISFRFGSSGWKNY